MNYYYRASILFIFPNYTKLGSCWKTWNGFYVTNNKQKSTRYFQEITAYRRFNLLTGVVRKLFMEDNIRCTLICKDGPQSETTLLLQELHFRPFLKK